MTDQRVNDSLRAAGAAEHLQGAGRSGLLERWQSFVQKVEGGYPLGMDDYCNELDTRELIEDSGLGEDPGVKELDRRLAAQLQHTDRKVWVSRHEHAFWIHGYPRQLSPEMAKDLGL